MLGRSVESVCVCVNVVECKVERCVRLFSFYLGWTRLQLSFFFFKNKVWQTLRNVQLRILQQRRLWNDLLASFVSRMHWCLTLQRAGFLPLLCSQTFVENSVFVSLLFRRIQTESSVLLLRCCAVCVFSCRFELRLRTNVKPFRIMWLRLADCRKNKKKNIYICPPGRTEYNLRSSVRIRSYILIYLHLIFNVVKSYGIYMMRC